MWRFKLKNLSLKIKLSYDPVILLMGIYLKKIKNTNLKRYTNSIFIAAFFTIVKMWKQPRCPSTDG